MPAGEKKKAIHVHLQKKLFEQEVPCEAISDY